MVSIEAQLEYGRSVSPTLPPAKHLVLLGGGHSHALTLRMLGMDRPAGIKVSLVSDTSLAPYSGMLPGLISGAYTHDEVHIDLRKLCLFAGAAFIDGTATGIDTAAKRISLEGRPPMGYDVLSINTGSTPKTSGLPGMAEFAVPAKPVPEFLEAWDKIVTQHEHDQNFRPKLAIAGGGAGGVELALSMHERLDGRADIHLIHSGAQLLPSHGDAVRKHLVAKLKKRGVAIHLNSRISGAEKGTYLIEGGSRITADTLFWVTQASPPAWLKSSGLDLTSEGFIHVGETLQSTSHPSVFAAGDVATIKGHPRPKSGVFAVRAAKPLEANLRRLLDGDTLLRFQPQKQFLSLIGTADGSAVASKNGLAFESPLMWKWKDQIDRKFMRRLGELPPMDLDDSPAVPTASKGALGAEIEALRKRAQVRCRGCAAKIGSGVLSDATARLREVYPTALTLGGDAVGLDAPDDAAAFSVPSGNKLIQTVDSMPSLLDDPFIFGRITALHSFSDIFAMGGTAHSALANVLLDPASEALATEQLFQVLAGVCHELEKMGAALLGGHTAESDGGLSLALSCNGLLPESDRLLTKGGALPGHALILTKPLGTATIFAAEMQQDVYAEDVDSTIASMLISNANASQILAKHGATACTDVTGFGLLGHLVEMLRAPGLDAELSLDKLPALPGAQQALAAGHLSSLAPQNARSAGALADAAPFADHPAYPLLFDPQTSGGLLATVPAETAERCLDELRASDTPDAICIGKLRSIAENGEPEVFLTTTSQ